MSPCRLVALPLCGAVARFLAGFSGCSALWLLRGLTFLSFAHFCCGHVSTHTKAGGCLLFGLNTRIIDVDADAAISRRSNKGPEIVLIGEVYTICALCSTFFCFLLLILLFFCYSLSRRREREGEIDGA